MPSKSASTTHVRDYSTRAFPGTSTHDLFLLEEALSKSRWLLKELSEPFAKLEVSMAEIFQYLLLNQAPKMRLITDDDLQSVTAQDDEDTETTVIHHGTKIRGTASALFERFTDLTVFLSNSLNESAQLKLLKSGFPLEFIEFITTKSLDEKVDWLREHGLIEALAASAALQDDDIHKQNIGIVYHKETSQFCVVRVDFDMGFYSYLATKGRVRQNVEDFRDPQRDLKLSANDISHFPALKSSQLYYWPTIYRQLSAAHGYSYEETQAFAKLAREQSTQDRAFPVFLQYALMPETLVHEVFDDEEAQSAFKHSILEFRNTLLNCTTFRDWLVNNTENIKQALFNKVQQYNQKVQEHNQQLASDAQRPLTSITNLEKQYNALLRDACLPLFSQAIAFLNRLLEKTQEQEKHLQLKQFKVNLITQLTAINQSNMLSSDQLTTFITELKSAMNYLKEQQIITDKRSLVFESLERCILQLSGNTKRAPKLYVEPFTVTLLDVQAQQTLRKQADTWLTGLSNGHIICQLFDTAYHNYKAQYSSLTCFLAPTLTRRESFDHHLGQLKKATDTDQMKLIISDMFMQEKQQGPDSLTAHFAKVLLGHVVLVCSTQLFSSTLSQTDGAMPFLWDERIITLINQSPNICLTFITEHTTTYQQRELGATSDDDDDFVCISTGVPAQAFK